MVADNYKCEKCGRTTYVVVGVLGKQTLTCRCGGVLVPKAG